MTPEIEENIKITRNCISNIFNRFYTWKTLQNSEYNKIYKKESYFWGATIYSLHDNSIIEIAKILEKTEDQPNVLSVYSLIDLLSEGAEKEEIINELMKYDNSTQNLIKWRNNYLAHRNKYFAFNPQELSRKFPLNYDEIEAILKLLQKVLGMIHSEMAQSGQTYAFKSIEEESQKNVDRIIKILEKGYQKERDEYKDKYGF